MKIKSFGVSITIAISILGGIFLSSAFGLWKTTNDKVAAKFSTGEFAGKNNPADIRGSYTFSDIEKNFNVPIEDLGKAFNVKPKDKYASFQCKELESSYGILAEKGTEIGTGSVRYFVSLYIGLPITLSEDTFLPKQAVEILKEKAPLTKEQVAYIETHSVELPDLSSTQVIPPNSDNSTSTSKIIKGNTTFAELIDWEVKEEEIEKIIGDKIPSKGMSVKEYVSSKNIEFVTIKEKLQSLVK